MALAPAPAVASHELRRSCDSVPAVVVVSLRPDEKVATAAVPTVQRLSFPRRSPPEQWRKALQPDQRQIRNREHSDDEACTIRFARPANDECEKQRRDDKPRPLGINPEAVRFRRPKPPPWRKSCRRSRPAREESAVQSRSALSARASSTVDVSTLTIQPSSD